MLHTLNKNKSLEELNKLSSYLILAISVLLVYIFLNALFEFPFNNKIMASAALLIFISTIFLLRSQITRYQIVLFLIFFLVTILVARSRNRPWFLYFSFYWILVAYSLGLLMTYTRPKSFLLYIPFFVAVASILIGVFIAKDDMTSISGDSGLFLLNRNAVAMFVFTFAIIPTMYNVIKSKSSTYFDLANLGLLIFTQSLTQSRAGLLIALLYTALMLINFFISLKGTIPNGEHSNSLLGKYKMLFFWLGIIAFLLIFFLLKDSRLIESGFKSSGRIGIFKSYFNELTLSGFLVGFKPSLYQSNTHMHNSFLELLVTAGFIGALPVYIILIVTFVKLLRKSFVLTAIFSFLMLYSMVEFYTLYLYGDFALIPLIIIANEYKGVPQEKTNR